jgi:glycine/D-amino acid oxidase-like deaminating enzyme/nitrite reductase/ring-hydroxylating ferredoxin subunit
VDHSPPVPSRTSGETDSPWTADRLAAGSSPLSPLTADAQADVCVIGAGIAGLTTAYLLALDGRDVVVLEDGFVGSGETGRTTAHFTAALDDRYLELERLHGADHARLAARSHVAAIDQVERIVAGESIACGFERVDGYLFLTPTRSPDFLREEREAAARAGVPGVEVVERAPVSSFDTGPALRFPRQAQLHPLAYLDGLVRAFLRRGGRLHTGTHATEIDGEDPIVVATRGGPVVRATAVVQATNAPVFHVVAVHTKQAAYRTYAVAFEIEPRSVPPVLLWDTGDEVDRPVPYHYVRTARARDLVPAGTLDLLIVGGEDHKTGQADDAEARWERLAAWTRERFPARGDPRYRWSGQVMEPVDGLAYLGRAPGRRRELYLATGDSGNGMTHGTLAGMCVRDLIVGGQTAWTDLYDPARKTAKATGAWLRENADALGRVADWVRPGDVQGTDEIPAGGGAVLADGLRRLAVHRDARGVLHTFSAQCPHLGCVVHWNSGEATWDCPCHGSRFSATGAVLNGPANVGLELVDLPGSEVRPRSKDESDEGESRARSAS